ncbi:MAG: glycine zipper 2TM domain-containing protein [Alphaproteobacteria bacterium]|nr:MAG: glycine zipper 2TM domain-containing protein [Alphaproteobacteria bacterium]
MKKIISVGFLVPGLVISALVVGGCARNISSSMYSESSVGSVAETLEGTILKVRSVTVKGAEKLGENATGMAIGGLTGGVLGHQFGKGRGNIAATVGGGLLGAGLGALAEDALTTQEGLEYVVRLTDGRLKTVVQGKDNPIAAGQRVLLYIYSTGRSRVVAF